MPDPDSNKSSTPPPERDFDLGDILQDHDDPTPSPPTNETTSHSPGNASAPIEPNPATGPKPVAQEDKFADAEIPGLADPDPSDAPKRFLGLKTIEIASLIGAVILILALIIAFRSTLVSQVPIADNTAIPLTAPTPIKGSLVGIAEIDTHWRSPADGERVAANQALVPELKIRLGKAAGNPSNGFLRIIIRDGEGRIRGDVTTLEIISGNFGESGSNQKSVVGTEGFARAIDLTGYGTTGEDYWTAEVLEGASYGGDAWEPLTRFAISHRRIDSGKSSP